MKKSRKKIEKKYKKEIFWRMTTKPRGGFLFTEHTRNVYVKNSKAK